MTQMNMSSTRNQEIELLERIASHTKSFYNKKDEVDAVFRSILAGIETGNPELIVPVTAFKISDLKGLYKAIYLAMVMELDEVEKFPEDAEEYKALLHWLEEVII